jgi:hypothetical protein
MKKYIAVGAPLAIVLLLGSVVVAGDLKSGPQVGAGVGAFEPDNVTGTFAGTKRCLV